MSETVSLLPLYAFMSWRGKTLRLHLPGSNLLAILQAALLK